MRKFLLFCIALATLAACSPSEPKPDPQPAEQEPVKADQANHKANGEQQDITDRMAKEHADDEPTASEGAKQAPATEVVGKEVEYFSRAGEPITGYLAEPKEASKDLPAIIVIHEWWGLNDNIRAMTRRLAGEGYRALAVDLYNSETADTPEAARRLMNKTMNNDKAALVNLSAARRWLEDKYNPSKMGIIGWCFGGGWSLRGALNMKENVDAVVMYYGEVITDESQLADLQAPLLGIFGAEDQGIPVENVREFDKTLAQLDKEARIQIFENAGHAFANPSGKNYNKETAQTAWELTTNFFEEHLKE